MSKEIWKNLPSVRVKSEDGWVKVYEAKEHEATIILDCNEGVGAWYGLVPPEKDKQSEKGITCREGDILLVPVGNTLHLKTFKESIINASITQKIKE
jgi:hypothetical protein